MALGWVLNTRTDISYAWTLDSTPHESDLPLTKTASCDTRDRIPLLRASTHLLPGCLHPLSRHPLPLESSDLQRKAKLHVLLSIISKLIGVGVQPHPGWRAMLWHKTKSNIHTGRRLRQSAGLPGPFNGSPH